MTTSLPLGRKAKSKQIAFRPESTTQAKLAETLVALANATGGLVLIGVDPYTGEPQGLEAPDTALDLSLKAALATEPPLIVPMPQFDELEGKQILQIRVPPGLPHVYSYRGKYLIRDGNHNRPLSPRQLRILMMERGTASFELLVPENARFEDLDLDKAREYLAGLTDGASRDLEDVLLQRGCLSQHRGTLRPTYAGLLLFGHEPQRWVRSAEILVVRYTGTSMDDRFVKEEIYGTLPEQIRRAEASVVSNIRRGVRLAGVQRVEETEYPVEAVREAIVNAVAHRDYQIGGDETRILLYADRIEFYSPGRLPGHVTVDNLIDERFSRNEVIVQVLADMGFIERLGYGIDRIMQLMANAGLPAPRFEETTAGFQLTIRGHGELLAHDTFDTKAWRPYHLNERQKQALVYLTENDRITNREYQTLCPGVSAETIRRDLADLVQKDLLLKIGAKRATYYIFK
jgi:ATP-dependent DNA helicase RecG